MSAALKSYVPRPVPSRRRAATASTQPSFRSSPTTQLAASQPRVAPAVVLPLAPEETPKLAVRLLSRLHLVSSVLAVSVVALTLVSYGTSVYVSRQLNQTNQKLSRLQRSEQQLTTANEVLKNYLAQQVQAGETGLQAPQPGNVIFLKPARRAAAIALPNSELNSGRHRLALPQVEVPLGY